MNESVFGILLLVLAGAMNGSFTLPMKFTGKWAWENTWLAWTIFALGIRGLGEHTKLASSLIVMSIVGGAIAPPLMGYIADVSSMRVGFAVPLICFVLVALYGMVWQKLENKDRAA